MKKNERGFTLMELRVVVLIIGVLAAVAVPQYKIAVAKSRVGTMLSLASSMTNAQEAYYWEHGAYAPSVEALDLELPKECTPNADNAFMFACGKHFILGMGGADNHVAINYCPDGNSEWATCEDTRQFKVSYFFRHTTSGYAGRRVCVVVNGSKLGKGVCSSLAGFECLGC